MDKDHKDPTSLSLFLGAMNISAQADAEKRSRPMLLTYRAACGWQMRQYLPISPMWKLAFVGLFVFVYLSFSFSFCSEQSAAPAFILVPWLLLGAFSLLGAAMLLPADQMYMDRLAFILPGFSPWSLNPKVLWSRVEKLSIIDLAKPGKRSQFALCMEEASGEQHHMMLSALDRGSLPALREAIESYAPHARNLVVLQELERFHDYQNGKLEGISYTQLWESGAALKFGLTSFTPLLPGAVMENGLTVENQIAAGGFSAVYLVKDQDGKRFVLKESVVPFNLEEELKNKAQEQFQREARLLAKLNHPQIAQVFDHFVENGRSYLRMQYIEGKNLRSYLRDKQNASEATTIKWLQELAVILAYLHEQSPPVVHRDLSPDNILVTHDERLVLIDFGAANEFIGAATGTLVGKHAYMAPEQIRANAEPRSDLYSLGACAFFCITGRDPEPIRRSSLHANGATVSDWFEGLVKKLTDLDRDERFASARDCLQYMQKPMNTTAAKSTEEV